VIRVPAPVLRTALVLLALIVAASWWLLGGIEPGLSGWSILWFALAAAAVEPLSIRQPRGIPVSASLAVLGAAAILGATPAAVAAMAGLSWLVGRLVEKDATPDHWDLLGRIVAAAALAGLAAIGDALFPLVWEGQGIEATAALPVGAAVAVSLGLLFGLPASQTLARTQGRRRHAWRRAREAVVATQLVGPAIVATAVLGALVHPVLGLWTLPTMLIPLLAARLGLQRLFVADRAYEQTIRAMSRLPERFDDGPLGPVPHDHGVRVGDLAREVALELGLSEHRATEVVRAAHLHEVGHIDLDDAESPSKRELAEAGGRVVRQVSGRLEHVAAIVEAHGDLGGPMAADDSVGLPAKIVAACCELDRYSPDPIERGQREEVVVRLVRDVGDLGVISALIRVLDRRQEEARRLVRG
jgi:hypothetical protein